LTVLTVEVRIVFRNSVSHFKLQYLITYHLPWLTDIHLRNVNKNVSADKYCKSSKSTASETTHINKYISSEIPRTKKGRFW